MGSQILAGRSNTVVAANAPCCDQSMIKRCTGPGGGDMTVATLRRGVGVNMVNGFTRRNGSVVAAIATGGYQSVGV